MKYKLIILSLLIGLSTFANSATHTKKILRVGCHVDADVCFVYVEGSIASSCPHNDGSFRWDGTDSNGKAALSILLSAHATGKTVTFSGSGCFGSFPAFTFLIINKS